MPEPQPTFVLVRPQMGENIGAAARAMWNFSLDRMRLVDPRDGWPNQKAVAMASGAGRLLDNAGIYATTAEALDDATYVYATTARPRGLVKPVVTPEEAMTEARDKIAAGEKVAVLFGPERAGLENDDIARANAIITVPVNPEFPSLNLAQGVLLVAYEWSRQTIEARPDPMQAAEPATAIEIEKLGDHYEAELEKVGFFFPETKAAHMRLNLRNLWTRIGLTRAEVQIFHGLLRQLTRTRPGPGAVEAPRTDD